MSHKLGANSPITWMLTIKIVLVSFLQLLLAMSASLGYMTIGLVRGFSSPGVPSIQQISPHLVPDDSAFSWISMLFSYRLNLTHPGMRKKEFLIVRLNIQHKICLFKIPCFG